MRQFLGVLAAFATLTAGIGSFAADSSRNKGEVVELFDATQAGKIEVTVRPRDAHEVRVEVKNNTQEPLQVRFPKALAAMPVLAQFQPPGGGFFGGRNNNPNNRGGRNNQGAPQVLGVAPQQGQNGNPFQQQGNGPQNGVGNFIFNVPAEKVVRVTMKSLCLEYGKNEPNSRNPYELKPIESFTDSAAVRELLESYGDQSGNEEVAQLAAWHLASGMSWNSMREMTQLRPYGKVEKVFDAATLERARAVVEKLPSQKKKSDSLITTPVSFGQTR